GRPSRNRSRPSDLAASVLASVSASVSVGGRLLAWPRPSSILMLSGGAAPRALPRGRGPHRRAAPNSLSTLPPHGPGRHPEVMDSSAADATPGTSAAQDGEGLGTDPRARAFARLI